ncbi:MAG: hypothetical protein ABEH43_03695 [Flavobacteriales bacterium]
MSLPRRGDYSMEEYLEENIQLTMNNLISCAATGLLMAFMLTGCAFEPKPGKTSLKEYKRNRYSSIGGRTVSVTNDTGPLVLKYFAGNSSEGGGAIVFEKAQFNQQKRLVRLSSEQIVEPDNVRKADLSEFLENHSEATRNEIKTAFTEPSMVLEGDTEIKVIHETMNTASYQIALSHSYNPETGETDYSVDKPIDAGKK